MPVGGNSGGSFVASGSINPSRFVKGDTSQPQGGTGTVIQCTGTDTPYGISQQGTRNPPYPLLDDGFAAIAGENIRVYTDDEECWLQTGTVAFNAWTYLKPDSTGRGTPASGDGDIYGAIALENSNGDGISLIRVKVSKGAWRGA